MKAGYYWSGSAGVTNVTPNWPAFFRWVTAYIKAPPLHEVPSAVSNESGK
jgi:hypothetical protein